MLNFRTSRRVCKLLCKKRCCHQCGPPRSARACFSPHGRCCCHFFVINSSGPLNGIFSTRKVYFHFQCLRIVFRNLFRSSHKQMFFYSFSYHSLIVLKTIISSSMGHIFEIWCCTSTTGGFPHTRPVDLAQGLYDQVNQQPSMESRRSLACQEPMPVHKNTSFPVAHVRCQSIPCHFQQVGAD